MYYFTSEIGITSLQGVPCSEVPLYTMEKHSRKPVEYFDACLHQNVSLAPVFLTRLVTLLSSEALSDSTISGGLSALKEEWMK